MSFSEGKKRASISKQVALAVSLFYGPIWWHPKQKLLQKWALHLRLAFFLHESVWFIAVNILISVWMPEK